MINNDSPILVTGAGGYLGHCLVAEIVASGRSVIAVDTFPRGKKTIVSLVGKKGAVVKCNILDLDRLQGVFETYAPQACIHLAALVGEGLCNAHPGLAWSVNRDAAGNTCRLAAENGCSAFILASTCSIYGVRPFGKASEVDIPVPISIYGKSKFDAEQVALAESTDSFRVVVGRLSTLFGISDRMRFDLTVNQFSAEAHIYGQIEVFSENTVRPYIHVRDAACALMRFALDSRVQPGIYNVGHDDHNLTKVQLIELIKNMWPSTEIVAGTGGGDKRDYSVAFAKIASLGWKPSRSVMDGIKEIKGFLIGCDVDVDIYGEEWSASCP
jgi:nucleoside-diphosphate-sugar epimerase